MHFIAIQIFFLLFHFLNVSCEPLIYFHSLLMGHDPLFGKHCLNWSTGTARERENFCGVIGGEVWKKEYDSLAQVQKFLDVIYFIFKIYPALSIDTKQDHLFFIKGFKSPSIIKQMLQGHMLCYPGATPAKNMRTAVCKADCLGW